MKIDFGFIITVFFKALKAVPLTLEVSIIPMLIGLFIGIIVALLRIYKVKVLSSIADFYVSFIRGTPIILQLFVVYYAVPMIWDYFAKRFGWSIHSKSIPIAVFVIIAFSINAGAYMSEIVRAGITAVNIGQIEACYSVGMTLPQAMRRVVLPQALCISTPMLCSMFIDLIKGSSLAFTISLAEITGTARAACATNYKFLEAYIAIAIIYWGMCIIIEGFSALIEHRFNYINKGGVA